MFIDIRSTCKVEQLLLKHAQNNVVLHFSIASFVENYLIIKLKVCEIAGFIPNPLRFQEKNSGRPKIC